MRYPGVSRVRSSGAGDVRRRNGGDRRRGAGWVSDRGRRSECGTRGCVTRHRSVLDRAGRHHVDAAGARGAARQHGCADRRVAAHQRSRLEAAGGARPGADYYRNRKHVALAVFDRANSRRTQSASCAAVVGCRVRRVVGGGHLRPGGSECASGERLGGVIAARTGRRAGQRRRRGRANLLRFARGPAPAGGFAAERGHSTENRQAHRGQAGSRSWNRVRHGARKVGALPDACRDAGARVANRSRPESSGGAARSRS